VIWPAVSVVPGRRAERDNRGDRRIPGGVSAGSLENAHARRREAGHGDAARDAVGGWIEDDPAWGACRGHDRGILLRPGEPSRAHDLLGGRRSTGDRDAGDIRRGYLSRADGDGAAVIGVDRLDIVEVLVREHCSERE